MSEVWDGRCTPGRREKGKGGELDPALCSPVTQMAPDPLTAPSTGIHRQQGMHVK